MMTQPLQKMMTQLQHRNLEHDVHLVLALVTHACNDVAHEASGALLIDALEDDGLLPSVSASYVQP